MTEQAISLWKAKLSQYRIDLVRQAIAEFIGHATRDEARGVVLGDITEIIERLAQREYLVREQVRLDAEHREFERAKRAGELVSMREVIASFHRIQADLDAKKERQIAERREVLRKQHEQLLMTEFYLQLCQTKAKSA